MNDCLGFTKLDNPTKIIILIWYVYVLYIRLFSQLDRTESGDNDKVFDIRINCSV